MLIAFALPDECDGASDHRVDVSSDPWPDRVDESPVDAPVAIDMDAPRVVPTEGGADSPNDAPLDNGVDAPPE